MFLYAFLDSHPFTPPPKKKKNNNNKTTTTTHTHTKTKTKTTKNNNKQQQQIPLFSPFLFSLHCVFVYCLFFQVFFPSFITVPYPFSNCLYFNVWFNCVHVCMWDFAVFGMDVWFVIPFVLVILLLLFNVIIKVDKVWQYLWQNLLVGPHTVGQMGSELDPFSPLWSPLTFLSSFITLCVGIQNS